MDRRAGKRLLNSSFRGLGGSEYKDSAWSKKRGGVTPLQTPHGGLGLFAA